MRHVLNTSSFFDVVGGGLLSGLYNICCIFLYGAFGATSTADRTILYHCHVALTVLYYYYYYYDMFNFKECHP